MTESRKDNLAELKNSFLADLKNADSAKSLEAVKIKYLGRKNGQLTEVLRSLKNLSAEQKRQIGPTANALRQEMEKSLEQKLSQLQITNYQLHKNFDVTLPGKKITLGHLHILTQLENEIRDIFQRLNFSAVEGPEVETEYYNFDALNIPADHPARDVQDTFWIKEKKQTKTGERLLMRTQTSSVQIHYMEKHSPPFRIISPGRVFRYEATDMTHEMNFYQVEGLMVDKSASLANFKFIIEEFFRRLFKDQKIEFRFRPSYFPFTEPSVEVDIKIDDKWLEIMGAGMVHPRVFEAVHYNPRDWQGFAFGMSIERLAMIKYGVPDIRLFYSGDLRFINQF